MFLSNVYFTTPYDTMNGSVTWQYAISVALDIPYQKTEWKLS